MNNGELFMWQNQQIFQISLQVSADGLFKELSPRFNPQVFLVGVLVDDLKNNNPICIEPFDIGYDVRAFADIKKLAKELEAVNDENQIIHSHPEVQKNHELSIKYRAYGEAILKILKRVEIKSESEKFISFPVKINGYLVFAILKLQKEILDSHYSLTKEKFDDRYTISRSFIESAITIFLKECTNALKVPDKSIDAIERPAEELLRLAAKNFIYTISVAGANFTGLHGLYDACNTISSLKYEGAEGLGKIIIAKNGHPNIRLTLQLQKPISIRDFRKVRKFLEVSGSDSIIVSDSAYIYGLGELMGKYNPKEESIFIINFQSHYKWEIFHDDNSLMVVEYRQPRLAKDSIDRDKFYSDVSRVFKGIEKTDIDNLWDITIQATKQKHGTMLVISDNAEVEAERLGNQSFGLKPIKLTKEIVSQITSIDGSVLLNRKSICYSIGVILDGIATASGDSSRGARYNSAIRYYEHIKDKTAVMVVIISEDGMINLIPNLKPQIDHKLIGKAIDNFTELGFEKSPSRKVFNQMMDFFQNIEFYLSKEECKKINSLRKKIEKKDKSQSLRIIYRDLKPNKEMNESYYSK